MMNSLYEGHSHIMDSSSNDSHSVIHTEFKNSNCIFSDGITSDKGIRLQFNQKENLNHKNDFKQSSGNNFVDNASTIINANKLEIPNVCAIPSSSSSPKADEYNNESEVEIGIAKGNSKGPSNQNTIQGNNLNKSPISNENSQDNYLLNRTKFENEKKTEFSISSSNLNNLNGLSDNNSTSSNSSNNNNMSYHANSLYSSNLDNNMNDNSVKDNNNYYKQINNSNNNEVDQYNNTELEKVTNIESETGRSIEILDQNHTNNITTITGATDSFDPERSKCATMDSSSGTTTTITPESDSLKDIINEDLFPSDTYYPLNFNNWLFKTKEIMPIALPIMLTNFMNIMLGIFLYAFVGNLGEERGAAAGLAHMYVMITGYSFTSGVLSALDTLCTQSYGAKNYPRVMIIFYRGVIFMWIMSIPIGGLWALTHPILLAFGQDRVITKLASHFVYLQIPGLPFYIFSEASRKYLQSQGIVKPGLVVLVTTNAIGIFLGYWLILHSSLGFYGFPIVELITNISNAIFMFAYIYFAKIYVKTYAPFKFRQICNKDAIKEFFSLGLPGAVLSCAEWIGFEIHSLMAGLLGTTPLAAQGILLNTNYLVFTISMGMGLATVTLTGNELGSGSYEKAIFSTKVALIDAQAIVVLVALVLILIRNFWVKMFSSVLRVREVAADGIIILALFLCADSGQGVFGGVIRGAGQQKFGAIVNLFSYYVIGVPVGTALAFKWGANLGLKGLWMGLGMASWLSFFVFSVFLYKSNWREWSYNAILKNSSNFRPNSTDDVKCDIGLEEDKEEEMEMNRIDTDDDNSLSSIQSDDAIGDANNNNNNYIYENRDQNIVYDDNNEFINTSTNVNDIVINGNDVDE